MSQKHKKSLRSSGDTPLKNPHLTDSANNDGIIQYGVGFDVHRDKIAACVAAQLVNGEILEIKSHIFRSTPQGVEEIIRFVGKYSPISCYLMECTGVYHLPLYHALRKRYPEQKHKVIAMNPLLLNRRISDLGSKNDPISARSLAFITFYQSLIKPSYIGTMQFFRLRDMIRSFYKAHRHTTACKNRIHRLLHSINVKIELNLNTEWCILFLDRLATTTGTILKIFEDLITQQKLAGLSVNILEKQLGSILEFGDIALSDEDRFVIRMELGRLLQEQVVAASFLLRAEQYVINNDSLLLSYRKLSLIPGLGSPGVLTILLELGDYTRFLNWKAFVKYCGVIPMIEESGKSKTKGHVNRFSNKNIRYVLTQAAGVILNRCDHSSDLGEFAYKQRTLKHLPYKKAMMKVANKLAKSVFNVLVLGVDYSTTYEKDLRRLQEQERDLTKKKTLLEPYRTRALRRDIDQFLGTNYEFLNSNSRFQLVSGFQKMIKKARFLDSDKS